MRSSPSSRSHSHFQRAVARAVLAVFLLTLPGSPPARADFAGAQLAAGAGSIEQNGNIITIHAADGTVFQFDMLNVWSHEELDAQLNQDGGRLLLEVLDGPPSHFDGGVFSNGFLYILNPSGIFFGDEAVVDVNGLVAAAGTLSHDDFLAGVDRFDLSGEVVNHGRIEAPRVALLGTAVANHGDILAPDGTIALVAGERVLLTRPGGHLHVEVDGNASEARGAAIQQTGTLDAGRGEVSLTSGDVWSLAINHEGITRGHQIELRADSGSVLLSGELDASASEPGTVGGSISVTGERVALRGAELDASGDAGGGSVHVGGERRGEGELPNARRTYVDRESVLRADATGQGDGGEVIVWADEATAFGGLLTARGGAAGGDGGFAEISGAQALWSAGTVDLGAPRGESGTLLYDPQDIEIVGGVLDGSDFPDLAVDQLVGDSPDDTLGEVLFGDLGDTSTPFQIYESEIEGTDANIVLEATNSIASSGTFTNEADGEGVGVLRIQDGRSLTMRTRNEADDDLGSTATPGIDLTDLALRTSGGGSVTLTTGDGAIAVGAIDTSGADGDTGGLGGSVTLDAGDLDGSGGSDIAVSGDIATRGGAGTDGDGGSGGAVRIESAHGNVVVNGIDARGGSGASADPEQDASGGLGGNVTLTAGDESDSEASGDLLLLGNVDARAGGGDDPDASRRGGEVRISAVGSIEHGGQAGPHVATNGGSFVILSATDVGAGPNGPLEVEGGGGATGDFLLRARGEANVRTRGFHGHLSVEAHQTSADLGALQIDVRQERDGATDVLQLSGSGDTLSVSQVDSTASGTEVQLVLRNDDDVASDGTLQIATGAVTAGGNFRVGSDGDVVIGSGDGVAITMQADPDADPGSPTTAGELAIEADFDEDGSGGIRDVAGSDTGVIDLIGDADEAGTLSLQASDGVGIAGDPITLAGGGSLTALNRPRQTDGSADPAGSSGIFVTNTVSGDLRVVPGSVGLEGVVVDVGSGDVGLGNAAGDLVLEGHVSARPEEGNGSGGDVTLAVTQPGSRIVADTDFSVESGGLQTFEGPLALRRDLAIESGGGAELDGPVDSAQDAPAEAFLRLAVDGVATFHGSVGASRALAGLAVDDITDGAGTLAVDADEVITRGDQSFAVPLEISRDVDFRSLGGDISLDALDADHLAAGPVSATIEAGRVRFAGDVGAGTTPLDGLAVSARQDVTFVADGSQSVTTGDGGIHLALAGGASPPETASIGKRGGDLRLETTGAVEVADGQKLSVQGALEIEAASVRVTDLSALAIDVASPDVALFAREPGFVARRDGSRVYDGGTDILANTVRFSSAPAVEGAGPAPRVATQSGVAVGAGTLTLTRLPQAIVPADLVASDGVTLLDLAIPLPDPGNETPELEGGAVELLLPAQTGDEASAPGALPRAEEIVAYLECAAPGSRAPGSGCAEPRRVRPGSALDTDRARDLADRYRELLGDDPAARAARRALAEAASDPAAPLPGPATPEAARRYLGQLAQLLAEARLLGIDDATQAEVRRALLEAVRVAISAPGLDLARLEQAVRASGPGLRI